MTIERGELIFTNRNGTRYYGANKDDIAIVEYRQGSAIKLDADVMDDIMNNNQSISITTVGDKVALSNFPNGYASIKERGSGKHITSLHHYICGILPEKHNLFIFKFVDNDSLNLCRNNILLYKRMAKIGERDGISMFRVNKLKNDSMEIETNFIFVDSRLDHVLFDEGINDYATISIVNANNMNYAHFSRSCKQYGTKIADRIVQGCPKINKKLTEIDMPICGITRLNGIDLDFTLKNLSFMLRLDCDKRLSEHNLSQLLNVTYSDSSYTCRAGVIAGKNTRGLTLTLKTYSMSTISNVLTQMNDEIERIRQYSIQDILDDENKFTEFKELYEGITPVKYKILADRLEKKK